MAPPGWERGRGSVDLLRAAEGMLIVQCSNIATPAQVAPIPSYSYGTV
jgi:hypothetical protein